MEISSESTYTINSRSEVLALEFSPYEWCQNLLAVGLPSSVRVYVVTIETDTEEGDLFHHEQIWECHVSNEPNCLAWSPKSSLLGREKCLQLLVSTSLHSVFQLTSDLKESNLIKEVSEHKSHINSITFSGDHNELFAASTGDDLVVKVWHSSSNQLSAKFHLTSPGVSVKFNVDDPDLLLVGERCGILRLYSISKCCAKMALRSPPTLSVDWSLTDPSLIVSSGPQGICVWTICDQQPSRTFVKSTAGECVNKVAICPSTSSKTVAYVSIPNCLKFQSLSSNKVPIASRLKVVSDISWHLQEPYVAVGSDTKIHLFRNKII